jgi:prepilin-type N-terminal cleavage/methylation domain-containing protein
MKFSYQNIKPRKAFSLMEMSVVILIIGMLIAGISQGIDLYSDFKIQTAQKLTINSPVSRIEGLALWLETTLEKSFQTKMVNNSEVPRWNNISPFDLNPKNAFNYSTNPQPTFLENNINGLPAVQFKKSSKNCMHVESGFDNNTENVTIFVALTLRSLIDARIIEKWSDVSKPYPYVLRHNFLIAAYSGISGASNNPIAGISNSVKANVPYIVSARRVKSESLSIWLNGVKGNDRSDSTTATSTNTSPLYIGCQGSTSIIDANTNVFGDFNVGEIIIYSRALSNIEISRVNQYLSQKWNIKF